MIRYSWRIGRNLAGIRLSSIPIGCPSPRLGLCSLASPSEAHTPPPGVSSSLWPAVYTFAPDSGDGGTLELADEENLDEWDEDLEALPASQWDRKETTPEGPEQEAEDDYARQMELESLALERTVERYRSMCETVLSTRNALGLGPIQRLLARWFKPLETAIYNEQLSIVRHERGMDRFVYGPFLLLLPPEKLAAITLNEVLSLTLSHGGFCKFVFISSAIGRMVQAEVGMMRVKSERKEDWTRLQKLATGKQSYLAIRHAREALNDTEWSMRVVLKIGTCLLNLLLHTATVPVDFEGNLSPNLISTQERSSGEDGTPTQSGRGFVKWVPAFRHQIAFMNSKKIGIITVYAGIDRLVHESGEPQHSLAHFPMLIPPRSWLSEGKSPYLSQRVPIIRLRSNAALQLDAVNLADMAKVYQVLDILGRVPFRINPFVHDVVQRAWANGGGIAEIPSLTDHPIPPLPPVTGDPTDPEVKKALRRQRREFGKLEQMNRDLHSLRCDMRLKLEVAKKFENDVMYFPHNLDFRGRVYPIPPHLNHMGADLSRGLLKFANPKPLGPRGLRWLMIHLSNLMGNDKASFDDRVAFTKANMANVMDSVDRPLDGNRWWLRTDSPWQALATCAEITAAIRSGRHAEYHCSLPVHQDGSCNGLQHYAALGRDPIGGAAVNLTPGSKPGDVYTDVCRVVQKRIAADLVSPPPSSSNQKDLKNWESNRKCASFVNGNIDRKVVKQTVMTSVYGVTFAGARAQIKARLREKMEDVALPLEEKEELIGVSSGYVARLTLESIGELFHAADQIKDWLATCARLIAQKDQPVAWVTPLGLPAVQPYRSMNALVVKTILQDVLIAEDDDDLPVSVARQKSAFPPNYVHSLDSTHMMMTALDCDEKGITFTAVHDSYWTHACDVDKMNASLRNQFIALYSTPLLEQLRDSFVLRFPGITFPPLPARGTLDLSLVKDSPYFFN